MITIHRWWTNDGYHGYSIMIIIGPSYPMDFYICRWLFRPGPGGHWQWRVQNAVDAEKKLMRFLWKKGMLMGFSLVFNWINMGNIYIYVHTYIHTYTHTHTHIYIYIILCITKGSSSGATLSLALRSKWEAGQPRYLSANRSKNYMMCICLCRQCMLDSSLFPIVLTRVASLILFFLVGLLMTAMTITEAQRCSLMCNGSLERVLVAGRHDGGCTGA